MTFSDTSLGLRRFVLTVHVAVSVGWLGAVVAFFSLAATGLTGRDPQAVRAAYVAMDVIARSVIVPFALASLLTGTAVALGTRWGLFRHYWVLAKFLLTVVAVVVLLLQLEPIGAVATVAAETTLSGGDLREARMSLVAHAGGGLAVLLANTALSVYKPRGLTPYGRRMERERRTESRSETSRP